MRLSHLLGRSPQDFAPGAALARLPCGFLMCARPTSTPLLAGLSPGTLECGQSWWDWLPGGGEGTWP